MINTEQLTHPIYKFVESTLKFKEQIHKINWDDNIDRLLTSKNNLDSLTAWISKQNLTSGWHWICDPRIDYSNFDFNWLPDRCDLDHIHCFVINGQKDISYTWLINTEQLCSPKYKFVDSILKFKEPTNKINWTENIDKLLINENNLNKLTDWIIEQHLTPGWYWICDPRINYSNFDFTWLPDRFDLDHIHCFTLGGQKELSYTWLINTEQLLKPAYKFVESNLEFKEPIQKINWLKTVDNLLLDKDNLNKLTDWIIEQHLTPGWHWICDSRINYDNFDFNWLPNQWDLDNIHCFTLNKQKELSYTWLINTEQLHKPKHKFVESKLEFKESINKIQWPDNIDNLLTDNDNLAKLTAWLIEQQLPSGWHWVCDNRINYDNFDFNWLPNQWDLDQIHCFTLGGQKELSYTWLINSEQLHNPKYKFVDSKLEFKESTIKIHWPDNIDAMLIQENNKDLLLQWIADQNLSNGWYWICDRKTDYSNFNFDWMPSHWDSDTIHCFAFADQSELSLTWLVNTEHLNKPKTKFIQSNLTRAPIAKLAWPENIDAMMSTAANNNYANIIDWVKNNNLETGWYWICDDRIDYNNFDFNWLPELWEHQYVHCFSLKNQSQLSYTWLINTEQLSQSKFKFVRSELDFKNPIAKIQWPYDIDNCDAAVQLQDNMISWANDQNLPEGWFWITDSRIDYRHFNFNWMPDTWNLDYTHCFTMQEQNQLSYTWLTNKRALATPQFKYIDSDLQFAKPIDKMHWPNFLDTTLSGGDWNDSLVNWLLEQNLSDGWHWVCDSRINYDEFNFSWLPTQWDLEYVHCFTLKNNNTLSYTWLVNTKTLKNKKFKFYKTDLTLDNTHDTITLDVLNETVVGKSQRFLGNMTAALTTAVRKSNAEWLWIISNCCDYANFNFKYRPNLDQIDHTHCWPSGKQEKGETFLIHIPSFNRTNEFRFNFGHASVKRKPWPRIAYSENNLVEAIKSHASKSLYTVYHKPEQKLFVDFEPCIWEKRPIVSYSNCNAASLVPRDCIAKEEIYEYPFLERRVGYASDTQLDIVFLHNSEKDHSDNYQRLINTAPKNLNVNVSAGITPRLKAYQTAAELSTTDWFLAVFAKCYMVDKFKSFKWRPDYWQKPKHYIFYNHNCDLDITYGHMAPIAYNKQLMLENTGGLDMTLAQEHTVVPLTISETKLTDPWDIWRTAFRETVKLKYYAQTNSNIELQYRLEKWIDVDQTENNASLWYKRGSTDAEDFFKSIDGSYDQILVTNEWVWLRERFDSLYATQQI